MLWLWELIQSIIFKVKRNNVICSLGDYLDDLAWLYATLLEGGLDATLLLYLRSEFEKYKFQLFESTLPYDEIPVFEDYLASIYLRRLPRYTFEFEKRVI